MAAAFAMSPPSNWMIRFGKTGAMIPNARKSSATVIMMNANVARDAVLPSVAGGRKLACGISANPSLQKTHKF